MPEKKKKIVEFCVEASLTLPLLYMRIHVSTLPAIGTPEPSLNGGWFSFLYICLQYIGNGGAIIIIYSDRGFSHIYKLLSCIQA